MNHPALRTLAAIAASLCRSATAAAQDPEPMRFCPYQPALDDLVGVYKVTSGPGRLSSGGIAIPLPDVQTYQATAAIPGWSTA